MHHKQWRAWTKDEEQKLRSMWKMGERASAISRALGRTRNEVIGKAWRIGISRPAVNVPKGKPQRWSAKECGRLLELIDMGLGRSEIATMLGRTPVAVQNRCRVLGVSFGQRRAAASVPRLPSLTSQPGAGSSGGVASLSAMRDPGPGTGPAGAPGGTWRMPPTPDAAQEAPDGPESGALADGGADVRRKPDATPERSSGRLCQFIAGDPTPDDSCKCLAPVKPGSSYCPEHHARCWQPPETRAQRIERLSGLR